MRTLFEIIEAAQVGDPTTHEECLYALLAYKALSYFDYRVLMWLAFEPSACGTPEVEATASFGRWQNAMAKSPQDWLGPDNDPAHEDSRERIRRNRHRLDEIVGDMS